MHDREAKITNKLFYSQRRRRLLVDSRCDEEVREGPEGRRSEERGRKSIIIQDESYFFSGAEPRERERVGVEEGDEEAVREKSERRRNINTTLTTGACANTPTQSGRTVRDGT